jgi:hypothetical protein
MKKSKKRRHALATVGWHGWMKAAGAFNGLPRELRHDMLPI